MDSRPQPKPLRPPPNYKARGVQLRLLFLVFCVMFVLALMSQARKPESWAWMWAGSEAPPTNGLRELLREPTDNRSAARIEAPAAPADLYEISRPTGGDTPSKDPQERNRAIGWSKNWEKLDRNQHRLLYAALKATREQNDEAGFRLTEADRESILGLVQKLDTGWTSYHDLARESLAASSMTPHEVANWETLIAQSETEWQANRAAFERLAENQPLDAAQRARLAVVQNTLDGLALSRVKEGPVTRTYDESQAWYRFFEKLQSADPKALSQQSPATGNYLVLTNHPKEMRGQLVQVDGWAKLGYRVKAPANLLGVDHFYVYWVRPDTTENSPIVVYALEQPPGFPELKDRAEGDTELDERVSFVGYFFKIWVYGAKFDVRDAPLILARGPVWTPSPPKHAGGAPLWVFVTGGIGAALLALGATFFVYRSSLGRKTAQEDQAKVALHLNAIDDKTVAPPPGEMLRQLAENETTAARPPAPTDPNH